MSARSSTSTTRLRFDKETARRQEAVFVAPGHPLLEALIKGILDRCQPDLQRGAVFADPDGRLDGWLWFLVGEVRDGNDQVAGKRLFAVFQPADGGDLQLINSSTLWDLKPLSGQDVAEPLPPKDPVVEFAVEHFLEPYRADVLKERQRESTIKACARWNR